MRYETLTGQVQAGAALPDRQSAERALRATLETLAERVPDGLADHMAAQLPTGAGEHMRRVTAAHANGSGAGARNTGEAFDLTSFAGRIAWRAGTDEDGALRRAAAVLEVLDAALSPELSEKLAGALPRDIRALMPLSRGDAPNPR